MAFAQSFSSSFEKSAQTAGAGALSLIKEKMEKEQKKADLSKRILNITSVAEKFGGPDIAEKIAGFAQEIKTEEGVSFLEDLVKTQIKQKIGEEGFQGLAKRAKDATEIAKAEELGLVPEGSTPKISGVIPIGQTISNSGVVDSSTKKQGTEDFKERMTKNGTGIRSDALGGGPLGKAAQIEVVKQTEAQRMKEQQSAERDFLNADLKIGNTLDSFVDYAQRNKELFDLKPGFAAGSLGKVLSPLRLNEFRQGLIGGLVEVASASARTSMPGTRAIRAIDIFKDTTVNEFDTIESGVQNSADSFRNALSTDMANSPELYIDNYETLSREGKIQANGKLKAMAQSFEETFRDNALKSIWKRGKESGVELLQEETIRKIESQLPEFDSPEEGDKALEPGEFFRVGYEVMEAS